MKPAETCRDLEADLPQRLAQAFQLHYETALARPQMPRKPSQQGWGPSSSSSEVAAPATPSERSSLSISQSVHHGSFPPRSTPRTPYNPPVSGLLLGAFAWHPFGNSQPQQASDPSPSCINFPQFRMRPSLSNVTDTLGSSGAEQGQAPGNLKRPAPASLAHPKQKKRGRKNQADAAASTAAAAGVPSLDCAADSRNAAVGVVPKAPRRKLDAAEFATAMLQQHKAKAKHASPYDQCSLAPLLAPASRSGVSMSMKAPSNSNAAPNRSSEDSLDLALIQMPRGADRDNHSASSASNLNESACKGTRAPDASTAAPAPYIPANAGDESLMRGCWNGASDQWTSPVKREAQLTDAVPGPRSVPALSWLMVESKSQAAGRIALLRSCQEQVTQRSPVNGRYAAAAASGLGSLTSLSQIQSAGAPASSQQSKPPASVVAAASELLARHGPDCQLEMLPSVSAVKGRTALTRTYHRDVASQDSEAQTETKATMPLTSLLPVHQRIDGSEEQQIATHWGLDLHLHL